MAPSPARAKGGRYALLVGVKQYDRAELSALDFTENDVTVLAQVLRDGGYKRVVLLTQTRGALEARYLPTAANIRKEMAGLLEDRTEDDTVVVGFAGHGVQFDGSDEPYFCPMDAKIADKKTLISLGEIYGELKKCKAKVKVLLSDACRNDPLPKGTRAALTDKVFTPKSSAGNQKPPENVVALFSCSAGERAYEHGKLKHGVFFHHLIDGLRGKAAARNSKEVTLTALVDHVQREVRDFVKEEVSASAKQRPELVGRISGAVSLLELTEKLARSKPGEVKDLVERSLKLFRANKLSDALKELNNAVGLDAESADALSLRSHVYYLRGEYKKALADAERVLKLDSKRIAPHYIRGGVALAANDPARAVREYDVALEREPTHRWALYDRGRANTRLRKYALALADFDKLIGLEPDSAMAYHGRGLVRYHQAKLSEAREDFTLALARDPKLADAYADRAVTYVRLGKAELAMEDCDEAIKCNPKLAWAHALRGQLHLDRKDHDSALRDLNEALRLQRGLPGALYTRARLHLARGKARDALADLDTLVKASPRDAGAHNLRGHCQMKLGKTGDAVAAYSLAIKLEPRNARFYANRAAAYARLGQKAKADSDRAAARKLQDKKNKN
jgi:tetratricopeptide (TPR) repeat protein